MDHAGGQGIEGSRAHVPGYTLERGISVDRTGALVAAHDDATRAPVVIRLLTPGLVEDSAFRKQLRNDMEVLCALRHQYLIAVIAYDAGAGAVIGEAVESTTLSHLIDVGGPLHPAAALVVLDDCLAGLEVLHAAGVLHRDVRPDVVLLDGGGSAMLRDAAVPAPPLHAGWRAGTPQYMAPELWAGRPHSVSTDLYAATGVLVTALTGHPPYPGTDLAGLGGQHTHGPLPSEAVPMLARGLVISGLAKDPRDRAGSAALFRRDVDAAGLSFIGERWRDQGRAWLSTNASARIGDPAAPLPVPDSYDDDDDDDGGLLPGIATAADLPVIGGVGWRVWAVAAAALTVLAVVVFIALRTLGGSASQLSPTAPAVPLFTGSSAPTTLPAALPSDSSSFSDQATPTTVSTPTATPATPIPTNTVQPSLSTGPSTPTATATACVPPVSPCP